jgi:anaerobic magnesium-protoporphyrin IX monomethyl ester cyclase
MKVFLIYIRSPKIASNSVMPLGILYIASTLMRDGFEVRVFDTLYESTDAVMDELRRFQPDLIGVSFLTTEFKLTSKWIAAMREVCPRATLFGGGAHLSSGVGDRAADQLGLDFAVYGEGEVTTLDVCRRLRDGRDYRDATGIIYRDDSGRMVKAPPTPLVDDLDTLPHPARQLLNREKYLTPPGHIRSFFSNGTLTAFTSRGCNAHCTFCDTHILFGRSVRRRSVKNVMEEIEDARQHFNFDSIYFMDDTFTLNQRWVYEFCDEIKRTGLAWGCETRVTSVNEPLLRAMKDANCVQVDYGVESGSPKVLKGMKKGITRELVVKAFDTTRKVGIRTFATFMVGLPEELEEDVEQSISLVKRIKPNFIHVTIATPLPGTELWDIAIENGWVDAAACEELEWDFVNTEEPVMHVNFTPKQLLRNRQRVQNANFTRSYLSIFTRQNLRHIAGGAAAAARRPWETARALANFFRLRNADVLLLYFMKVYQLDYIRRHRGFEAPRHEAVFANVNPNYMR